MMMPFSLNKKIRLRILASFTLVVIFQLICMGHTTNCAAADPKTIEYYKELFKDDKKTIKKIQTSLGLIFHDFKKPKEDGIIGPETTHALNDFCSHFEIKQTKNLARELAAALFYYAAIAETEPTWEKDTSKQNFISWLSRQLACKCTKSPQKILNPEAPQRLILLKFFKYENQYLDSWSDSAINATAEINKTQRNTTDQWIVSFEITANDLKKLETKIQILEQLQNFQDKEFSDKRELTTALKTEFKAVIDQSRHYDEFLSEIVEHADKLTTYKLTEQYLIKLKSEEISEETLKQLRDLRDVEFKTEDEFKKAIENAGGIGNNQAMIKKLAHQSTTYRLTEQSLKKLKSKNIPKKILAQIQRLEDIEYLSEELFFKALTAPKSGKDATDCLRQFLEHSDELESYKKTKECFKDQLALVELVAYWKSIKRVARKEHFFETSKSISIEWSGGSCGCVLDDLPGVVYGFYPFWIAGDKTDKKENKNAGEQKGEEADNLNIQNEDDQSLKQELDFSVLSRIGYYALSFDENGDIYERLPWEPEDEQLPWEKKATEKSAESLKKARKYRTAVDLVIYQNDWKKWSQRTKEKLLSNIVKLVKVELTDPFSRIKPYISFGGSSVPTVVDGVTLYFDGYPDKDKDLFVDFIKELRKDLKALRKDYYLNIMLHRDAIGKGIFDFKTLRQITPKKGKGEQGYEDQNDVDYFLVFLEEPTKETKKTLRENVEKLFTGIQRRNMLRKIIPIITPIITRMNHNKQQREDDLKQLEDDLIYFDDNFGGVGFWTLPKNEGSGVDLMTCVKEILPWYKTQQPKKNPTLADDANTYLKNFYQKEGAILVSGYQNFVTLHRWGFRILFDLLLAIIAAYALLSAFICWFRVLFVRLFWWFISVVLFFIWVFFSLLYCDPSWKNFAEGNLILFLVILVIAVIIIFGYIKKSKLAEQP
jgi:hypothetical protein